MPLSSKGVSVFFHTHAEENRKKHRNVELGYEIDLYSMEDVT